MIPERKTFLEQRVGRLERWLKGAVVGYMILFIGGGVNFFVSDHFRSQARESIVDSTRAVATKGCNRDFRSISALRGVLIAAQKISEKQPGPESRKEVARKFYKEQLKSLTLPDCREPANAVNDKPGTKVVSPKPLYPGHNE